MLKIYNIFYKGKLRFVSIFKYKNNYVLYLKYRLIKIYIFRKSKIIIVVIFDSSLVVYR